MTTSIATSTIVQQAFRFMERTPPQSFDDATEEANAAAEQYPIALAHCLELADWSFASALVMLPERTVPAPSAVDPDLPYFFALPGDLVVIREVGDGRTKFRRDREGIRADAPGPLRLRYTARIDDEARTPARFQTAVAAQLAVLLSPRFLTTASKIETIKRDAEVYLKDAARADARTATEARYDGRSDDDDWATEATR